jgi:hypothetical protein
MLAGNLMRSLHRNTIKVCKLHKLLTNLGNNLIDVPKIYNYCNCFKLPIEFGYSTRYLQPHKIKVYKLYKSRIILDKFIIDT